MTQRNRTSADRDEKRTISVGDVLVVSIVAALVAAVLLPTFAVARNRSQQTTCMSNERQINMGMMQYVRDYDETFPQAVQGPGGRYGHAAKLATWAYVVTPYVKSMRVFICPSEKLAPEVWHNGGVAALDVPRTYQAIIQYNGTPASGDSAVINDDGGKQGPFNVASIAQPAHTMWMTESGVNKKPDGSCYDKPCRLLILSGDPGILVQYRKDYRAGGSRANTVAANHSGGTNWCFADGHVEFLTMARTLPTPYNRATDLWVRQK